MLLLSLLRVLEVCWTGDIDCNWLDNEGRNLIYEVVSSIVRLTLTIFNFSSK